MERWTINTWNQSRGQSVPILGANGIYYEYILKKGGNPDKYYEDAIDVRSHKSPSSKYDNNKKPGQYQPIGDKRYFNFYQLKKMTPEELNSFKEDVIVEVK